MITILDGKKTAQEIYNEISNYVDCVPEMYGKPKLSVLQIGDNSASNTYINNKKTACEKCGIEFEHTKFDADIDKDMILDKLVELRNDKKVDGILLQLPLPDKFKELHLEYAVPYRKDVDGFLNSSITPCTPKGIMTLLNTYKIDLTGKHVVILGRSKIVGKPLIDLCLNKNATVTSCNSYTKDLKSICETADIIISAIGKPKFLNWYYLTSKCTCIIDVGMNRDENGKLCGDVDFNDIMAHWKEIDTDYITRYITPVPRWCRTYDCCISNAKCNRMLSIKYVGGDLNENT